MVSDETFQELLDSITEENENEMASDIFELVIALCAAKGVTRLSMALPKYDTSLDVKIGAFNNDGTVH